MKIVIEVADDQVKGQLAPLMPRVVDAFQTHLREMRPVDFQGSAGLFRLREELTRRVNVAVAPARVNAVLFREIVIQ
jgi:flagellar FliL protein